MASVAETLTESEIEQIKEKLESHHEPPEWATNYQIITANNSPTEPAPHDWKLTPQIHKWIGNICQVSTEHSTVYLTQEQLDKGYLAKALLNPALYKRPFGI